MDAVQALQRLQQDPRYLRNLDLGRPRRGHPEGSLRAHIAAMERNLKRIRPWLFEGEEDRLRLLIHVHDILKPQARNGVPSTHPQHHARLAREMLAEFSQDADLLAMLVHHDDGYWFYFQHTRHDGIQQVLEDVEDVELFLLFTLIDGCLPGKMLDPILWFVDELSRHRPVGPRVMECLAVLSQA